MGLPHELPVSPQMLQIGLNQVQEGPAHVLRRVAADILAATTVILQGTPSRTDAKGRAERSIDLECRARLARREETGNSFWF